MSLQGCVRALIAAEKAGIPLSYDRACAIDLAVKGTSKTVLEAVRTSINPRVIDCPNPSSGQTRLTSGKEDEKEDEEEVQHRNEEKEHEPTVHAKIVETANGGEELGCGARNSACDQQERPKGEGRDVSR